MSEFDRIYREQRNHFGPEPSEMIKQYISELPLECRVLDVGTGQGRNVLELARRGIHVGLLPTWGDHVTDAWGPNKPVFDPSNAATYG